MLCLIKEGIIVAVKTYGAGVHCVSLVQAGGVDNVYIVAVSLSVHNNHCAHGTKLCCGTGSNVSGSVTNRRSVAVDIARFTSDTAVSGIALSSTTGSCYFGLIGVT